MMGNNFATIFPLIFTYLIYLLVLRKFKVCIVFYNSTKD